MHCHDALAGPGRARDPCRSVEISLHRAALSGMQEHQPLFPWPLQRLGERCLVGSDPEAAPRIRVEERIGYEIPRSRPSRWTVACGKREQRFLRLLREPVEDSEQIVIVREPADRLEIDGRYAEAQEVIIALGGEERRRRVALRSARGGLFIGAHNLLELDDLRGSGDRMRCDRPALCPTICRIVMIDIHQDVPIAVAKDDDAQIHVRADRMEPAVAHFERMQPVSRRIRVHPELHHGLMHQVLFLARQPRQTLLKAWRQRKIGHGVTRPYKP